MGRANRPSRHRKRHRLRIAAILGVKDEVELIEGTIAHLRAIGVELIVVWDVNSTDGTQDILERCRSEADFWIYHFSDDDPELSSYHGPADDSIRRVERAGFDWVIFLDADEYWLPASGSLKDCAAFAGSDEVTVDRFNVPLIAGEKLVLPACFKPGAYGKLPMVVEPIPDFRNYMRENPETSWIRGVPAHKVAARPACIKEISEAMHYIVPFDDATLRRSRAGDIVIAHVPFSSRERFRRKIENVRKVFATYGAVIPDGTAWHWKRWLEVVDRDGIDREFERNIFDPSMIAELRAQGIIRSAAEVLGLPAPADASAADAGPGGGLPLGIFQRIGALLGRHRRA